MYTNLIFGDGAELVIRFFNDEDDRLVATISTDPVPLEPVFVTEDGLAKGGVEDQIVTYLRHNGRSTIIQISGGLEKSTTLIGRRVEKLVEDNLIHQCEWREQSDGRGYEYEAVNGCEKNSC